MSTTDPLLVSVLAVGLVLGLFYDTTALDQLRRIRRVPPLTRPQDPAQVAAADTPAMRFRGETFERSWQGSRGYVRGSDQRAGENLADRLFVTTFYPLRPSRFNDTSYWRKSLPGVGSLYLGLFLVVPLIVAAIGHSSIGRAATFNPTPSQQTVPRGGQYVSHPTDCNIQYPQPSAVTGIDDTSGGKVFYVDPGASVVVSYLYGKPLFSPGSPLCPEPAHGNPGLATYVAGASGSGFVYIPQPNGTVVAKISVVQRGTFALQSVLIFVLFVLTLMVSVVGIVLTILIRSHVQKDYS